MIGFDLVPLFPELFLAVTAMAHLIIGVSRGNHSTNFVFWASAVTYVVAALILVGVSWGDATVLNGMFKFDNFAGFMKLIILLGLLVSAALSVKYLDDEGISRFEYPVLMTCAGIGMMLMVSANNLLALIYGAGAAIAEPLCAGGFPARFAAIGGSGREIFLSRRAVFRDDPVRHFADLWLHGYA
jgi:NADH-quinone oxidoreductase subunit N